MHGLIHADPHPGNVLLTTDGRLTLLDLGMVAHVPPRMRDQLLKLRLAIVTLVASSLFNDRKTRPKEERYPI